ncbi:MAG TPA: EscV/YscV/HrcV family type III secretion system export apparatus protein, partial [Arcobacter sp.]|nr:EscV/YscV/HrcV family type III secretion system export apparatus protein [Arcobacter sp.]
AQIPALIISTATAIIITRSNTDEEKFASGTIAQLVKDSKSLIITGLALLMFGLVPGFPSGILFTMGLLLSSIGYLVYMIETDQNNAFVNFFKEQPKSKVGEKSPVDVDKLKEKKKQSQEQNEEKTLDKTMKMEVLELKLGAGLLALIQGDSELLDKIKGIRNNIAGELGFVIPQIRISDGTNLELNEYSFNLKRIPIAKGKVEMKKLLAMGGIGGAKIDGMHVKEPVFGLSATWITEDKKSEALQKGFTVVDAPTIISTHISELIKKHAEDILTRQDIVNIVDRLKESFPVVVEESMKITTYGTLLRVCKDLLHEKIPIVDMLTILESLADIGEVTKSPEILLEHVRSKLFRLITNKFMGQDGVLHLITLKPELEQDFTSKLQEQHGVSHLMLSINEINMLVTKTKDLINEIEVKGISNVVLVVDPVLRKRVSEIFEKFGFDLPVLSHAELDTKAEFAIEGTVEF